jgi:hypothetical protein
VSDDFPIRPWEHDYNEENKRLHEHGYHHVEGFEGVWQKGYDEPVTRAEALEEIASRYD